MLRDKSLLEGIWVVYHDSDIKFASRNRKEAERVMSAWKKEYPGLVWSCTSIEEYGSAMCSYGYAEADAGEGW